MTKYIGVFLALVLCLPIAMTACGGGGGGGHTVTASYVSDDTPLDIPDADDFSGVVGSVDSFMLVTGAPDPISKVTLTINIDHSFTPDLWIYLTSPNLTTVLVSYQNGGGSGADYWNTTFDDDASVWIYDADNPFSGSYRPDFPLSNFNGDDPNGVWMLTVIDDWEEDTGTLNSWGLNID